MRIDREAFFVAVAALAGCERADSTQQGQPPAPPPPAPPPAIAMPRQPAPPEPEPVATPEPAPPPVRTATVHHSSPKRWFLGLTVAQRTDVTSVCEHRANAACQQALSIALPRGPGGVDHEAPAKDRDAQDLASLTAPDRARVAAYCAAEFTPPSCETPLVVAFDNQPVDFAASQHAQFAFVPGAPAATDWPTAATPWIALDLDGDGAITSGAELFGSSTVLPGGERARNGFAALAALDANGDGVLDAEDPMFARLALWTDRDGDHRSSPAELRPLSATVGSISLSVTLDPRCNARGDCEGERGSLRWRDSAGVEHAGTVVDVYIPK